MKHLIGRLEPVIWALFGGGFFVGCLLMPAFIFMLFIAAPLGWLPADAVSYERAHSLATNPIGRLVLLVLIVLPFWNGANHLRHFVIDLRGIRSDGVVAPLCYGAALVVTAIALVHVGKL
jgi:fumarate reductase subunit D